MSDFLPALITTAGTLVGSFGGFTLAARSQRRQGERDDARALQDAERARLIELENERHTFQLKTLLGLQELTRLQARSTILAVEEDRQTLLSGNSYGQLASETPEDFANSVEFSHHVARVTHDALRERLERFSALCAEYSIPPMHWRELDNQQRIAVQEDRFVTITREASETAALLGEHLRAEINRHNASITGPGRSH